jgi:hypothetical protein
MDSLLADSIGALGVNCLRGFGSDEAREAIALPYSQSGVCRERIFTMCALFRSRAAFPSFHAFPIPIGSAIQSIQPRPLFSQSNFPDSVSPVVSGS